MKKEYINPEMEVIEIKTTCMLASSVLTLDADTEITSDAEILAPELTDALDLNLEVLDLE